MIIPETSPSIPQEVYPAKLLDRDHHVIAEGHVKITSEGRGTFEMSLLEDSTQIESTAAFIHWGTEEPRRLKSLRFGAGLPFSHFDFTLEA